MAKGPSRCGELFLLRCACARVEATANGAKLRLSRLILLPRLLLTPVPAPSAILSLPGTGRVVETSQCEGTAKSPPQKSQQIYEGPPERPARLQNAMLLDSCDNHLVVQTLQYFFALSGRRQRQRSESEDICHADRRHLSPEPRGFSVSL